MLGCTHSTSTSGEIAAHETRHTGDRGRRLPPDVHTPAKASRCPVGSSREVGVEGRVFIRVPVRNNRPDLHHLPVAEKLWAPNLIYISLSAVVGNMFLTLQSYHQEHLHQLDYISSTNYTQHLSETNLHRRLLQYGCQQHQRR